MRTAVTAGPLAGQHLRLESLQHEHVPGLLVAASGGGELYRWSPVPQDEAQVRRYVETAVAARDAGEAVPFAVVRMADDTVIGARFEGILRAHRLGADLNPRDSVRFSITAAEWPSVRLRLDELSRRYQPA